MDATVLDMTDRLAHMLREQRAIPAPQPGMHRGIPMEQYHAWDAASNSRLSKLRRSPAHLRAYLDEAEDDTPAKILGRVIHSAILEPDDFAARYVSGPEGDRRTKAVKEAWVDAELQYGPGHVLKSDDYQTALRTRDAVHAHASVKRLFAQLEHRELSIVWTDEATGATVKARFDGYAPDVLGGVIMDVKSTEDASQFAFSRSIYTYGYHRQGALYCDGAESVELPVNWYLNIAVEKKPPFAVAVYLLKPNAIETGRRENGPLLRVYHQCTVTNQWPAYSQDIVEIDLPPYADSQINDHIASFGTNYEVTG